MNSGAIMTVAICVDDVLEALKERNSAKINNFLEIGLQFSSVNDCLNVWNVAGTNLMISAKESAFTKSLHRLRECCLTNAESLYRKPWDESGKCFGLTSD